jgi:hypothetical protein
MVIRLREMTAGNTVKTLLDAVNVVWEGLIMRKAFSVIIFLNNGAYKEQIH